MQTCSSKSTKILMANPFGNFHKLILHILKVIHCLSNWLSWERNDENNNKTWSPIAQSLWRYRCRTYPFDLGDNDDVFSFLFFCSPFFPIQLVFCFLFGRFFLLSQFRVYIFFSTHFDNIISHYFMYWVWHGEMEERGWGRWRAKGNRRWCVKWMSQVLLFFTCWTHFKQTHWTENAQCHFYNTFIIYSC